MFADLQYNQNVLVEPNKHHQYSPAILQMLLCRQKLGPCLQVFRHCADPARVVAAGSVDKRQVVSWDESYHIGQCFKIVWDDRLTGQLLVLDTCVLLWCTQCWFGNYCGATVHGRRVVKTFTRAMSINRHSMVEISWLQPEDCRYLTSLMIFIMVPIESHDFIEI